MNTNEDVMIKLENVSVDYFMFQQDLKHFMNNILKRKKLIRKNRVLKNISFELNRGDTLCLSGSNGVGKSTLL